MKMIIANTLAEGRIVFLAPGSGWTPDIAVGAVANNDDEAAAMLARARQDEQANLVVDPNLIPVGIENGVRRPLDYREYIRATGPSVPIPGQPTGHP
jgi:hypothetical protein